MKKIGLVGGISWSSTIDYYRLINEEVNNIRGGLHYAECIICSLNFDDFNRANSAGDWEVTFKLIADAACCLERAGAEVILLGANTAHAVADRVKDLIGVPLLDIRTVTAQAVQARQLKTVGLLGTTYTMELNYYKDKLLAHNIQPLIPESQRDRNFIEHSLLYELGKGILVEETKKEYIRIGNELIERGAEGIILGCTEIPLLIGQDDFSVPVFNTTLIHAQAAVQYALSDSKSPRI